MFLSVAVYRHFHDHVSQQRVDLETLCEVLLGILMVG